MSATVQRLADLLELLRGDLVVLAPPVRDLRERYGARYEQDAVTILGKLERFAACFGETLSDAIVHYLSFVRQLIEERRALWEQGRIRISRQSEVEQLMEDALFKRAYLYALTLSTVFDRSRYDLACDYRDVLARYLRPRAQILEIGAGNCLGAEIASAFGSVEAYEHNDLSLVWWELLGLEGRVELAIRSYEFADEERFDLVSMIALLEHLADPGDYLERLKRVLRPQGLAYLTLAIRMPQVDHLSFFQSVQECRDLLAEHELVTLHERYLVDTYMPYEEEDRWRLAEDSRFPATLCALVRKRAGATRELVEQFCQQLEPDDGEAAEAW